MQIAVYESGSQKRFAVDATPDIWTHYAVTYIPKNEDEYEVYLYVNGEHVGKVITVTKNTFSKIKRIGTNTLTANNTKAMDDVRIYTTVLSPEDIKVSYLNRMKLYDNGSIGAVYLDEIEVQENKPISLTDSKLISNIYEVDENGDPIEEFSILEDGIYAPEFREV